MDPTPVIDKTFNLPALEPRHSPEPIELPSVAKPAKGNLIATRIVAEVSDDVYLLGTSFVGSRLGVGHRGIKPVSKKDVPENKIHAWDSCKLWKLDWQTENDRFIADYNTSKSKPQLEKSSTERQSTSPDISLDSLKHQDSTQATQQGYEVVAALPEMCYDLAISSMGGAAIWAPPIGRMRCSLSSPASPVSRVPLCI